MSDTTASAAVRVTLQQDNVRRWRVLLDGKPTKLVVRRARYSGVGYEVADTRDGSYIGPYPTIEAAQDHAARIFTAIAEKEFYASRRPT